ncbi:MAG TPA: hypothetical protein VNO34_03855 [Actinomycetota bacterium]|nr:hypothetical protein [Actinomycetota bacterium]
MAPVAGPALVAVGVLATLFRFAFLGRFSPERLDVLGYFFPSFCFLGRSLAAGDVPLWNPHVMGGVPFAADPQSGWMYAPAMGLFSLLSCPTALGWFVVLHPLVGGLGLYAFLRAEGLSRPAATVGGLALALPLAGSDRVLNFPAATGLAWTPVALWAAARCLRAPAWAGRLGWAAATAVAWGQLAAGHMSDGLVRGTLVLAAYLAVRSVQAVRRRERTAGAQAALLVLLGTALPVVNLAFFLPRLAYLGRTSIALGYERLRELSLELSGGVNDGEVFAGVFVEPGWPLRLALSPGLHVGMAALFVAFSGLWARRHRALWGTFLALAVAFYVLSQAGVAEALAPLLPRALADLWLHDPGRSSHGLFLCLAVLAGLGLEGWREASWGRRAWTLGPAVLVWAVVSPLIGIRPADALVPAAGAVVGGAALALGARRSALLPLVPAVLALEMSASGLVGQASPLPPNPEPCVGRPFRAPRTPYLEPVDPLRRPDLRLSELLRPGPIVRALARDPGVRYLTLDPTAWSERGYHVHQEPACWPLLGLQQSMLFGLEEGQGYNPVQLRRYWTLARAVDPKPMRYNATGFVHPPPMLLDLLQVGYAVARAGDPPAGALPEPVARQGRFALYRFPHPPPRASVVPAWRVVAGPGAALVAVTAPGFDPAREVVLERDPGLPAPPTAGSAPGPRRPPGGEGGAGTASYRARGPQEAVVEVRSPTPALVLVRNAFDPGWEATVDGRPAPVLPADFVLQAVPVPAGRHLVELRYRDPAVGAGLVGSAAALGLFLAAAGAASLLAQRRARAQAPTRAATETPELARPHHTRGSS